MDMRHWTPPPPPLPPPFPPSTCSWYKRYVPNTWNKLHRIALAVACTLPRPTWSHLGQFTLIDHHYNTWTEYQLLCLPYLWGCYRGWMGLEGGGLMSRSQLRKSPWNIVSFSLCFKPMSHNNFKKCQCRTCHYNFWLPIKHKHRLIMMGGKRCGPLLWVGELVMPSSNSESVLSHGEFDLFSQWCMTIQQF